MTAEFSEHWSRKTDHLRDIAGPRLCCSPVSDPPMGNCLLLWLLFLSKDRRELPGCGSSCVGDETVLDAGVVV